MKHDLSIELERILRLVHKLMQTSFNVQFTQIAFLEGEEITLSASHTVVPKTLLHEGTIYAKSILSKVFLTTTNIEVIGLPKKIACYASVPLFTKTGSVLGCLILLDNNEREFSDSDIALFTQISDLASIVVTEYDEKQRIQAVFADFIHKTIHDLKNPFTSISLTAELLKRKADDSKMVLSFADRIENSNLKVFKILDDLKLSFPLQHENFKLNIQEINISCFLDGIRNSLPEVSIQTENKVKEIIYADEQRLKEAVLTVISYLFYMTETKTKLFIKSYVKNENAIIELSIKNIGDSTNMLGTPSSTLAIARNLIELQKGKLNFQYNEELKQYYFYIAFPLLVE